MRSSIAAGIGALTGVLSAASVHFLTIGTFPGIVLFGTCIGANSTDGCSGLTLSIYLGPGLIFGVIFGIALERGFRLGRSGTALFALASLLGNTVAVMAAVNIFQLLQPLFDNTELPVDAVTGLVAGAIGGGLLGGAAAALLPELRWGRLLAAGTGLGLLLPLALDEHLLGSAGPYIFYALWQGGFAAALATARRID